MQTLKILIAEPKDFSEDAIIALKEISHLTIQEVDELAFGKALNQFDVIWFRLKFKVDGQMLNQKVRCKFLVCPVTGLDHIDLDSCERVGITVLSLRGERTFLREVRATAEHTIALTLALFRNLPPAIYSVKEFTWNRDLFKGREIHGKTVGILGVGRLGSITAGYFRAFGARVIGYDIVQFDDAVCEPVADLESLLLQSDILSVHVNYNEANYHLLSFEQFEKMKTGSILVNTARGGIINSQALLYALEKGILSGAAVDVIENEFDAENDPLVLYAQNHDQLIITPHIGGNTSESFAKTELFMVQKLKNALNSIHA